MSIKQTKNEKKKDIDNKKENHRNTIYKGPRSKTKKQYINVIIFIVCILLIFFWIF